MNPGKRSRYHPIGHALRVGGLEVVVCESHRLLDRTSIHTADINIDFNGLVQGAVHYEKGRLATVGIMRRNGIDDGHLPVFGGLVCRRNGLNSKHTSYCMSRCQRERMEDRLPPRRTAWFCANWRDDIDKLRQACCRDTVTVPQQGDQQVADHYRVGDGVLILDSAGGDGPVRRAIKGTKTLDVPNVPLVKGDVDPLAFAQLGTDLVSGSGHRCDETVHVDGGS